MKHSSVLKRIRVPYLRKIVKDRLQDVSSKREADQIVSEVLGLHMVEGLKCPVVELTGSALPPGHQMEAGAPSTSFPNDTCPSLFEAVLGSYTEPGDAILHIFTRSSASYHIGRLLDRHVVMVDEYVSTLPNLLTPNLLAPSRKDLHQIAGRIELDCVDDVCDVFDLIHLHLPCPGIVERLALLGDGGHSVYGRCWEEVTKDIFWKAIEAVITAWSTILQPRYLTIQCGFAKWDDQYVEMFPQALRIAQKTGWALDDHWKLDLNPVPGPADTKALEQGWLLAFESKTGGHQ